MKKRLAALLCVLMLLTALTARAAGGDYVVDSAGVLTAGERADLDEQARAFSEAYRCGLYVVTVDDYRDYADTPFDAACTIYRSRGFGWGQDRDGLVLLLSMDDRDFATATYGPWAGEVFTDAVLYTQEEEFLDDFRHDDWYGGFSDFLTTSAEYLFTVRSGGEVETVPVPGYAAAPRELTTRVAATVVGQDLVGGAVVGLVVCFLLKAGMKSVRKGKGAAAYRVPGGGRLTVRDDRFTHATETRRTIQTSQSHGGGHGGSHGFSGGGFSGRSGKF